MTTTKDKIAKPEIVGEEHLTYLDDLQESGKTNMWGARRYLVQEFDVTNEDAGTILSYWMNSYGERHTC